MQTVSYFFFYSFFAVHRSNSFSVVISFATMSSDDIIFVKLYCFFYDTCGYDDIALVQPQYLYCLAIFRIAIKAANIIKGNMHPVNKPTRRLSPACCEKYPTMLGPKAPPISPATANSANKAVPPFGILGTVMLILPGHIIPTEKPHMMHPINPKIGIADRPAKR